MADGPVMVDCRFARRRETGGARYARGLAERLPGDGPAVRVLMGPPPLPRRNRLTSVGNLLLDLGWTHVAVPLLALLHRASAVHSTFNWAPVWTHCPRIVTVHDLSWERMPEEYPAGFRRFARIFTRLSSRRAARVIAVSESTAVDLSTYYRVPADRIDVVYTGIDSFDAPPAVSPPPREQIVLHVGEAEPRKRVPAIVEGFRAFAESAEGVGWRLELVGRGGADEPEVRRAAADCPGCTCRGYVDDDTLHDLYRRSRLLVSASRWEGFCLPVAEAAREGCPVLVADTPALREAGGPDAAVLREPVDAAEIARGLAATLGDPHALQRRAEQGKAHAQRFTWEHCIRDTRAVYRRVVG